ncbi:MAG TPA: UbiX family flavin prenyltransferase [Candidatus Paenalcaligenes intestinipullorum]|uniref:Flavin prenyltransferase UbiX n=1 Tax=Candidatus Paenalcaligenes intestinipullorum TaxID=2838718 RepID=A0A9D2RG07_9BURK|nr:UbiX family flavin prenyltransferase [Candidatus Paenalcaligenes intestinipullorum]
MNPCNGRPRRLIIGMTGATGALYTVRLLQLLRQHTNIQSHLVVSPAALLNLDVELGLSKAELHQLADVVHPIKDVGASIASGSFHTEGMVIVPCSMRSLAAVAHGFADNLITRAADVVLKERRRLVLVVRETPFNAAHLRNMAAVTDMGGIIFPPLPAFYFKPTSIEQLVDHSMQRVLALLGIELPDAPEWQGVRTP